MYYTIHACICVYASVCVSRWMCKYVCMSVLNATEPIWYLFIYFYWNILREFFALGHICSQRDKERQKVKTHPPGEWLCHNHSPLTILGTHTYVSGRSFKLPGLRLETHSTMWDSSKVTIVLSAGPPIWHLLLRWFQSVSVSFST